MTKDRYDEFFAEIIDEIKETRDEGQKEYAHDVINVFANFERTARQLNTTRDKVLMTFLMKHIDGIIAHVNGHTSQREDVRGRIKDAIVYLCLLWGMASQEIVSESEIDAFFDKHGFTTSKTPNGGIFNPDTGEVSFPEYQSTGDEVI